MKIYIDADACPVTGIIEDTAREFNLSCYIVSDHNHALGSNYCEVITVDAGFDAADLKIVNMIDNYDILITQDYGLATIALSKNVYVLNHFGKEYTHANIDILLDQRYLAAKIRNSKSKYRLKGPSKRLVADDDKFRSELIKLIERIQGEE
ncbi:MAG: YaiI/YqxD family protein [Erysipelothrix sp.]|nr:YaiI/YqxD family protein [Erysipelothrix sp.]